MSIRTDLALRVEQRLALSPRMLQSVEILQLATADLLRHVDEELERNETLEVLRDRGVESRDDPAPVEAPAFDRHGDRDLEWSPPRAKDADRDPKQAALEAIRAPATDLFAHIEHQLALADLPGDVVAKALEIAGLLDGRGYLDLERDELVARVGEHLLDAALAALRAVEPGGIGCRGPVDAMLAQLDADDPDFAAVERLLTGHLDALAARRLGEVAIALGLEIDELQLLLDRLADLEPAPARRFETADRAPLLPEVAVERRFDGGFDVLVDDIVLPVLGVGSDYEQLAADPTADVATRRWLRERLRSARDLIGALEHRRETLARVARAVFDVQADFLEHGPRAIRPLKMSDVARRLDLHTSTVSRAVAGKSVRTVHGVLPLKAFFDGDRGRAGGAETAGAGRSAILARIREAVAGEHPAQPLSDAALQARLAADGIVVARRTVAKYREELGILSSRQRRRGGGAAGR